MAARSRWSSRRRRSARSPAPAARRRRRRAAQPEAERLLAEVMQRPGGLSDRRARRAPARAGSRRRSAPRPRSASAHAWRRCGRSPSPSRCEGEPAARRRAAGSRDRRDDRAGGARSGRARPRRAGPRRPRSARRPSASIRRSPSAAARALEIEAEAEEEARAKKKGAKPPKSPVKIGDERRERIKLTINNAFDEAQRERSLASLQAPARAREAAPGRRRAAARQGHARGDHPRGDHHPGARQPHDGALRRRHQAADGAGRDAQDQRRHRRRHGRADRARVRPHAQARVGGRRRGRLHRPDRCRGRPASRARRSSPSWATSTTARPRCSTPSATPTSRPARPAASPSTSAPIR